MFSAKSKFIAYVGFFDGVPVLSSLLNITSCDADLDKTLFFMNEPGHSIKFDSVFKEHPSSSHLPHIKQTTTEEAKLSAYISRTREQMSSPLRDGYPIYLFFNILNTLNSGKAAARRATSSAALVDQYFI
ncbi:hypothetical protein WA026_003087 [Henosepilachna vigintioctopunctata]|uniref:Uncharacterized protein n=1 Tax=Henosepilachna vigintioctopunctata TaxID=420089 RepID=A0AAW1TIY2_9CUCU